MKTSVALIVLIVFFAICHAAEKSGSKSGLVDIGVSERSSSLYVAVINPTESPVRIGPMRFTGNVNDIKVYPKERLGLNRRSSVHVLPGAEEIERWKRESYLPARAFLGLAIPKAYFQEKYGESGCHDFLFSYHYGYSAGETKSRAAIQRKVCW